MLVCSHGVGFAKDSRVGKRRKGEENRIMR